VKAGAAVLILSLSLLAEPLAAEAQPAGKVYRLGYLSMVPPPDDTGVDSFREALRDLGYLEGRNIVLEIRHAEGKPERLPDLAADLVRRKVDLIVTATGAAAVAATEATQTIPIVMLGSGDVVRQGLVASLARPGGNVTGLTMISPELSLLARAFASAAKQRVQAVLGLDCPSLSPSAALLAELSLKHRLPAMYPFALYPRAGSLISYGASLVAAPRHAATYVDKILRGAKPGELPIEQTPEVELVINLKTAKALGLTIPPSLLLRADQVIE
jgi:putative tryptophan/tyrosine transport system substrate-binding protein